MKTILLMISFAILLIGCKPLEVDKEFKLNPETDLNGSGELSCKSMDQLKFISEKKSESNLNSNSSVKMRVWEFSKCRFEYRGTDEDGERCGLYVTEFTANGSEYQEIRINTTEMEYMTTTIRIDN
jgi:hypothetical protein